eukprot:8578389-Ditylum_brightwellii.AAC.1
MVTEEQKSICNTSLLLLEDSDTNKHLLNAEVSLSDDNLTPLVKHPGKYKKEVSAPKTVLSTAEEESRGHICVHQ